MNNSLYRLLSGIFLGATLQFLILQLTLAASSQKVKDKTTFAKDVKPFTAKYCLKCHTGKPDSGIFAINAFPDAKSIKLDRDTWTLAATYLTDKKMPPPTAPQPPAALRKRISTWIRLYLSGKIPQ